MIIKAELWLYAGRLKDKWCQAIAAFATGMMQRPNYTILIVKTLLSLSRTTIIQISWAHLASLYKRTLKSSYLQALSSAVWCKQ